MRCDFGDFLLHSYFDNELSAGMAAEFDRHVLRCGDCAEDLVDLDFLRARLQLAELHEPAPASLQRKIRAELGFAAPGTQASRPLLWHWLAAAAALFLIAIVGWKMNSELGRDDYQAELAEEIVDAHLHSLQAGHLTGIASNDESAVKGWFDGKVKFALPVHDFTNDGFTLRGGRLDVVDGRATAALVYAHGGSVINVFIWPTRERDTSQRVGSRKGYHWVDWRSGKAEFCAVSDLDSTELEHLHQLIAE